MLLRWLDARATLQGRWQQRRRRRRATPAAWKFWVVDSMYLPRHCVKLFVIFYIGFPKYNSCLPRNFAEFLSSRAACQRCKLGVVVLWFLVIPLLTPLYQANKMIKLHIRRHILLLNDGAKQNRLPYLKSVTTHINGLL